MKEVHRRIKSQILDHVNYPAYLTGSIKGCDYKVNASLHARARIVINEDISGFFPSTSADRVFSIWRGFFGFSEDVARCLTQLTTRHGELPQGAITGANVRVVDYFAFLHDVCRQHDAHDPEHGLRAAQFARAIRAEHIDLDDAEFNLLIEAIERHTSGSMHDDVTVATCWDADRLDIGRVGQHVTPDPSYLSTPAAKRPETIAHALARSRLWRQRYSIRQLTRGAGDTPIHLTHKDVVPIVNCEHPRQRMTLLLGVRKFMTDADWLRALSDVWGDRGNRTPRRWR